MAYAERGDYRAARASLDAQMARVTAARGASWPTLSLAGSYGTRVAAGITDNGAAFINRFMAANPEAPHPIRPAAKTITIPLEFHAPCRSEISGSSLITHSLTAEG